MIKGWKRPGLAPGPLKSLNDALHDLHARSGYRSSREIEKWIKADQGSGGISHTTVHKMFTSSELPRPELMHWVVKVLLDHSRVPDTDQVVGEFDALWNEAFEAQQKEQRLLRAKQQESEELANSATVEIPNLAKLLKDADSSRVRPYLQRPVPAFSPAALSPPSEASASQISVAELIARIAHENASGVH